MDDEQRPWWTRPPEPGPETQAVKKDEPSTDQSAPTDLFAPVTQPAAPAFQPFTFPTAPAAAPPTQPVVRRLADPPPAPRSDETETLPVVDDSIFATFTGELDQIGPNAPLSRAARASVRSSDPATVVNGVIVPPGGLDDDPATRRSPLARLPEGRVLLLAGAGGLVVLLIVVVALISGRGPGEGSPTPGPTKRTAPASASVADPGKRPDGLQEMDGDAASQLLSKANVSPGGTIVDAWEWNDNNGHNLVVTVISPAPGNKQTLRVIQVARLDGTNPKTLRIMRDPNLPNCPKNDANGTAGFTKDALRVRDLNGDNIAEVLVGWSSTCGGKGDKSEVKLALISNGDKYIIRGQGVIGQSGSGTSRPDPKISRWPASYRSAAEQLYSRLYF